MTDPLPSGAAAFEARLDVVEPMGMETMVYFIVDGVEVCGRVNPAAAGRAAAPIFARLVALFGGDNFPTPEQVLAMSSRRMRGAGLSRAKVRAIKDIAKKAAAGVVPSRRVVARLADATHRAELAALEGLPTRARLAPPSSARTVASGLTGAAPSVVVVLRSYLAPFGVTLAHELRAARVVVDADDDDEGLWRGRGDDRVADEHARLAREWLTRADRVLAEAGGSLRIALVRFDDRNRPSAVAAGERASRASSYGGSGMSPSTGTGVLSR